MIFPKDPEQGLVGDRPGIEHHPHHLVVAGEAAADFLVGVIPSFARRIADRRRVNAGYLPELALGSPKAAHPEQPQLERL